MKLKTLAFANQKGGVGKTTCCINVAAAVATFNKKVLLIDLDPQGNATMGSGCNKLTVKFTIGDVLQERISLERAVITTGAFDLVPSNVDVTEAEVKMLQTTNKQYQLTLAITRLSDRYDWIFIDCPPSLNILTLNAMIAADAVIIPMQCEYYALEGLSSLIHTIEEINTSCQKQLFIEGIIRNMYDARNKLCKDVSEQLVKHFGSLVYNTIIPKNIRLAEAPSHGVPILTYDKTSSGAKAYIALAKELLYNNQQLPLSSSQKSTTRRKEKILT